MFIYAFQFGQNLAADDDQGQKDNRQKRNGMINDDRLSAGFTTAIAPRRKLYPQSQRSAVGGFTK